jgi:isocitrate dehydrogenase kinase/phosphatase
MDQYAFVFNHYRVGRLIEAHTFEHLSFDRCWFSDELLDHLTTEAGQTVHIAEGRVIIDHAYLERRVTPLDIYLKEEVGEKADDAVVDFGNAIKDLAFANIFPGDMLLKNFGVTRHGRVVFYDYDEIVPLSECHFREIPQARTYMEEISDEPWYTVGEDDVFPEEFSRFLGLSPRHRDLFLSRHADLLAPEFWVMFKLKSVPGASGTSGPMPPATGWIGSIEEARFLHLWRRTEAGVGPATVLWRILARSFTASRADCMKNYPDPDRSGTYSNIRAG